MKRLSKDRRRALRFALYIERMGAVPTAYSGQPLSTYAVELQQQYQALRHQLGSVASVAARIAGRELIRQEGYLAIQTNLESSGHLNLGNRLPDSPANESVAKVHQIAPNVTRSEWFQNKARFKCQRKLRHLDYLSALLHARGLPDPDLHIYPCPVCLGLHVGHSQAPEARRRRAVAKELKSVNQRLRDLEREHSRLLVRREQVREALDAMGKGEGR